MANGKRSPLDTLAILIATGFGLGYAPAAPGTVGSLGGVAIYVALYWLSVVRADGARSFAILLFLSTILSYIGFWAATRASRVFRQKDPSRVVIDEIVGQLFTYAFVPLVPITLNTRQHALILAGGFFLFRAFDVVKPYPVSSLESLPEGLGIVADDILSGIYAGMLVLLGLLLIQAFPRLLFF